MGNQLSTTIAEDVNLQDIDDKRLVHEGVLGGGRLLKTIRCRKGHSTMVVKVYIKSQQPSPDEDRSERNAVVNAKAHLQDMRDVLFVDIHPNVCPYMKYVETDRAAYIFRQYFHTNLTDRLGTRPFLTDNEKKWITFQLLFSLAQSHSLFVWHGDIKAENVMLTSWNWVVLTDYAPFKPVHLSSGNPVDFSYYFDASGSRTCNLAPERFSDRARDVVFATNGQFVETFELIRQRSGDNVQEMFSPFEKMDIFSMGCVLYQLNMDGRSLFSYSDLLKYQKNEFDPTPALSQIRNLPMRNLISSMVQRSHAGRLSATEYLAQYKGKLFPDYYYTLHAGFLSRVLCMNSDDRITTIADSFWDLVNVFAKNDVEGLICAPMRVINVDAVEGEVGSDPEAFVFPYDRRSRFWDPPDKLDKLMMYLGYNEKEKALVFQGRRTCSHSELGICIRDQPRTITNLQGGLQIIASVICVSIGHVSTSDVAVEGLRLMCLCASHLPAYVVYEVILPYMMPMLECSDEIVRQYAMYSIVTVLNFINEYDQHDVVLYSDYVFPAFEAVLKDCSETISSSAAAVLPLLADDACRFCTCAHVVSLFLMKQGKRELNCAPDDEEDSSGADTPADDDNAGENDVTRGSGDSGRTNVEELVKEQFQSYQIEIGRIRDFIISVVMDLSTKQSVDMVTSLFSDISTLCSSLGHEQGSEFLLPMLISFLNIDEAIVRERFFRGVIGMTIALGPDAVEAYILPFVWQGLYDPSEFVVAAVIDFVSSLVELRNLNRRMLLLLTERISPLLLHPYSAIRMCAARFVACVQQHLDPVDVIAFVRPVTKAATGCKPLTRSQYQDALVHAVKFVKIRNEESTKEKSMEGPSASLDLSFQSDSSTNLHRSRVGGRRQSIAVLSTQPSETKEVAEWADSYIQSLRRGSTDQAGLYALDSPHGEDGVKHVAPYVVAFARGMVLRYQGIDAYQLKQKILHSGPVFWEMVTGQAGFDWGDRTSKKEKSDHLLQRAVRVDGSIAPKAHAEQESDGEESVQKSGIRSDLTVRVPSGEFSLGNRHTVEELACMSPTRGGTSTRKKLRGEALLGLGAIPHGVLTPSTAAHEEIIKSSVPESPTSFSDGSVVKDESKALQSSIPRHKGSLLESEVSTATSSAGSVSGFDMGSEYLDQDRLPRVGYEASNAPSGRLLANLTEHRGSISTVAVPQPKRRGGHLLFASGSTDGTVKMWDIDQLEKQACMTSVFTYNCPPEFGRVSGSCFLDSGSSLAVCGSLGGIHLIDMGAGPSAMDTRVLGNVAHNSMSDGITAMCLQANAPLELCYACRNGSLHGYDLRGSRPTYSVRLADRRLGYITSLQSIGSWSVNDLEGLDTATIGGYESIYTNAYAVIGGTSRGVITIWDIRFGAMPICSWQHPSMRPISDMAFIGTPQQQTLSSDVSTGPNLLLCTGENEVSTWELGSLHCTTVWSFGSSGSTQKSEWTKSPVPLVIDSETMATLESCGPSDSVFGLDDMVGSTVQQSGPSIRSCCSVHPLQRSTLPTSFVCGGSDCTLRFIDTRNPGQSFIFSYPEIGPAIPSSVQESDAVPVSVLYAENVVMVQSSLDSADIYEARVFTENVATVQSPSTTSTECLSAALSFAEEGRRRRFPTTSSLGIRTVLQPSPFVAPPSYHHDSIQSVCEVRRAMQKFIVSGSRDGVLKIWE